MTTKVWPSGMLGPMVMPLEWRDLRDCKSFIKDWNNLMSWWKQWKRPYRAYQRQIREEEKNQLRKWWFSLSKRERDYWMGLRDEGHFPNIVQQVINFKGPKYQRGSVSAFPYGTVAAAGSGLTLTLSSTNNDAFNLEFNPSNGLYATFQWRDDGDLYRDNSGNNGGTGRQLTQINSSTDWIRPASTNIGDDYEIIWDFLTGTVSSINDESFTEDTWTTMTLDERVGMVRQTASVQNTFDIDIGEDGTSTSLVNQDYTIEAGNLV